MKRRAADHDTLELFPMDAPADGGAPSKARRVRVPCRRCGLRFFPTAKGRIRWHECPHGVVCVPKARSRSARRDACVACFEARQRELFT